jgi:hypothetical protein
MRSDLASPLLHWGAIHSLPRFVGVWRSLVARLFWVQEVVGSSPAAPTIV